MLLIRLIIIVLGMMVVLALFPQNASALASDSKYVRTANYFLKAGTDLYPEIYDILASYDVLILPMEASVYNKDFFQYARAKHPQIAILAYVPSRSINIQDIDDGAGIRKKLKSGIQEDWYLRDMNGSIVSAWPSTLPLNVTSQWNDYLPFFVQTTIMQGGMWDGIFYDEVDSGISHLNGGLIDIDGDGKRDIRPVLDASWQQGMTHLLSKTRELLGEEALIVINGSSHPSYQPYINGRMFESFPTPWEGNGEWEDSMRNYLSLSSSAKYSPLFIIQGDTSNTGNRTSYQKMRFSLASALMGNGFFGFDFGTQNHGQLWQYDEYAVRLGKPSSQPYNHISSQSLPIVRGVWRRDFQQGTVLVNSSSQLETINFDGDFEKIRGLQDTTINDGSIVSSVSVSPSDGIILLRPLSTINGSPYYNGSFARIFDKQGFVSRNGFFAYDSSSRGSIAVYHPLDQRYVRMITADHGTIRISLQNSNYREFKPFGDAWNGELNLAIDSKNPHNPIIYVSKEYPQKKGKSSKKVKYGENSIAAFNSDGSKLSSFYPLGKKYSGSLRIAIGDLNADGSKELVVSTGQGTKPIVRIFDTHGRLLSGGFYAYQPSFMGGVYVAVADFDNNGYGRILTSPGQGGSPLIRIFDAKARVIHPGFMAFSPVNKGGVRVLAADIDGDGKDEVLATTTKVFTYALK